MKKLRKTIAILLCLCMLSISITTAMAVDSNEDRIWSLHAKLLGMYQTADAKLPHDHPATSLPIYTNKSLFLMIEKIETAKKYVDCDPAEIPSFTVEELTDAYNELEATYLALEVKTNILQKLYEVTKQEINDADDYNRRYYSERLWKSFCGAQESAGRALSSNNSKWITNAYFTLRAVYNELCKSNQNTGDIDGNGSVELADVLYLQKYMAKIVSMNSSQLIVADFSHGKAGTITTENVIMMQKYLAGMDIFFASTGLISLNERDYNPLIDEGKLI